ncbi:hypothetical protein [Paenibacillus sp. LHD-38]|uniref:hypothetical protein n=1 Tax=Paenibacillus sp. LHD-38 TaxID=3072143 RepID=UPI00280CDEDC|nr:hypothetical protein [Paenibacillus sp. LHD-38]MDQ8736464.1 hypothetical protein [Paenibacillus sp. LHD-38]
MLNTIIDKYPQRPVTFIHAAQNGKVHAMEQHVTQLAEKHPQLSVYYCYQHPTDKDRDFGAFHKEGYIDLPWLKSVIADPNAHYYFCGPVPFMRTINSALLEWGISASDTNFEFFGPTASLEPADEPA